MLKKLPLIILSLHLAFWPTTALSQSLEEKSDNGELALLQKIVLNSDDIKDWQSLTEKDLSLYDKRIMTELLPELVKDETGFEQIIVDRIRRGYDTAETNKSREIDGADNTSQHYFGKAVSLSAIGITSCMTESPFRRTLNPAKPVWIHWQTGEEDALPKRWPFGRTFDSVARQFFWLEARAFTNRPITSQSWLNFLQQIAKAEIEERFGLVPGALAQTTPDKLPDTIAKTRLARSLGLVSLPEANSEASFYETIGRNRLESELNLPFNSFSGRSWREIYQRIGFRVIEQQLALPTNDEPLSFESLGESPRFLQLKSRLEGRALYYNDPRLALNLPTDDYLATDQRSDIFTRVTNGDPDGFAIAGAYFLADSLELSPDDTKQLLVFVDALEDRAISLATARPLDPIFQGETLFSPNVNVHAATFESIGRESQPILESHRSRLNESLLLALTGNSEAPTLARLLDRLTSTSERDAVLRAITTTTLEDANYAASISNESLRQRGLELLSEGLEVPASLLEKLDDAEIDQVVTDLARRLDTQMGWPEGTTRDLAQRKAEEASPTVREAQERKILELGATRLWEQLRLPVPLQQDLNTLYFQGGTEIPDQGPAQTPEPDSGTVDSGEDEVVSDEEVSFAIPASDEPLATDLQEALSLPLTDTAYFLTGQMLPALTRATLGVLGREMADSSTVTPATLITLLDEPGVEGAEKITTQKIEVPFIRSTFFEQTKKAVESNNKLLLWRTVHEEATYQWNMECPDKQKEAEQAINKLVTYLVGLPEGSLGGSSEQGATRPIQILTLNQTFIDEATKQKISAAYPDADGKNIKWGVYAIPRAWDHVYVAY